MARILLVEDNEGDQRLLMEAFKDHSSVEIETADDADDALSLLKNKKIHPSLDSW